MFLRDMDLGVPVGDARRLEVVVDGLPVRGGAQLAVDTTLVCAHCTRTAGPGEEQRSWMGLHCKQLNGRRSPRTPNWLDHGAGQSLSCWLWRLVGAGLSRRGFS